VAVSFIGGWKPEYTEKTTDLTQVTDNFYQKDRQYNGENNKGNSDKQ
jgi:hypothetical protein